MIHVILVQDHESHVQAIRGLFDSRPGTGLVLAGIIHRLLDMRQWLADHGRPDVILLDLNLPDSAGLDTVRAARAACPEAAIIALGEAEDDDVALTVIDAGGQDYLASKDLSHSAMDKAVRHALARRRMERDLEIAHEELTTQVEQRTQELLDSNKHLAEALDQLGEAQSMMIQQERLHALERMASGIAHDFNNALSPILANSELLLMKPGLARNPQILRETLLKIHNAAEHCSEVVERLHEFYRTRGESVDFEPVDLGAIAKGVVSLTQPCWKNQAQARGATIHMEPSLTPGLRVFGAKGELSEMVMNLLLNAIDAIPKDGTIAICTYATDEHVVLCVEDTGVGMSQEVGARCLEPFFTTKRGFGSGLGLGVVYGIAQRHEAEIVIESELGAGTKVEVRFPKWNAGKAQHASTHPVYGLRVLVAEDEPLIREVLGIYLAEDAHRVEMASNGLEASEKLKRGHFDLIITDRSMPEMSGDQLAAIARDQSADTKIVLLTGFGDLMMRGTESRPDVDVIIPKPFTFDSLRTGISQAFAASHP